MSTNWLWPADTIKFIENRRSARLPVVHTASSLQTCAQSTPAPQYTPRIMPYLLAQRSCSPSFELSTLWTEPLCHAIVTGGGERAGCHEFLVLLSSPCNFVVDFHVRRRLDHDAGLSYLSYLSHRRTRQPTPTTLPPSTSPISHLPSTSFCSDLPPNLAPSHSIQADSVEPAARPSLPLSLHTPTPQRCACSYRPLAR